MIRHIHINECHSTQDELKEQLTEAHESQQILVSCESQTHGYGRNSNSWTSLPGTLCFSLTIQPSVLPSFTALEISLLILNFFSSKGKNLTLKWPNDLWNSNGLKCAGILVQSSQQKYLAGIGLNLFSSNQSFGGIFENEFSFDKKKLAHEISDYIYSHRYHNIQQLTKDWETRCGHMNHQVTITEGSEIISGEFLGLGEHGEARIKNSEKVHLIYNGSLRINSDHLKF